MQKVMQRIFLAALLGLMASVSWSQGVKGPGPESWAGDLSPIKASDWSYERARHLLERAGFGGTPEEVQRLAKLTPQQAVDTLVDYERIDNSSLPAFDSSRIFYRGYPSMEDTVANAIRESARNDAWAGFKAQERGEPLRMQNIVNEAYYLFEADREETKRLAQWWAARMLATPRPLEEKLALFWHGHFATANNRAYRHDLMKQHYEMLRGKASGSFKALLTAVSQDPQMLIWLDNRSNTKEHPNENYAREVMELFTLGIGNYTEQDIREMARAFTGWTLDADALLGKTGNQDIAAAAQFKIRPELHDNGQKSFLGKTGNFDGYQAIDILLEQPAAARFISWKLYKFFVRSDPTEAQRQALADTLRRGQLEIKPFLKTLFLSKDFYSPAAFATQIKSPVQLTVSTYRKLGFKQIPGIPDFRATTASLGQELFFPPNVAGWEGGRAWINPATMFERGNFAQRLLFADPQKFAEEMPFANFYRGRPGYPPYQAGESDAEFDRRIQAYFDAETKGYLARTANAAPGNTAAPSMQEGSGASMNATGGDMMLMNASRMSDRRERYAAETYSLGVGVSTGYGKAFARVKPIARVPASIDVRAMARSAKATTTAAAVDYFVNRLLLVPLEGSARTKMVTWLTQENGGGALNLDSDRTEATLRKLLVLIMSSPEYQLG